MFLPEPVRVLKVFIVRQKLYFLQFIIQEVTNLLARVWNFAVFQESVQIFRIKICVGRLAPKCSLNTSVLRLKFKRENLLARVFERRISRERANFQNKNLRGAISPEVFAEHFYAYIIYDFPQIIKQISNLTIPLPLKVRRLTRRFLTNRI